ncbi:hypothetical protein, partial [Mycobacterium avium]|uniref:hypothetical protein n=1 Tax=Mycobacterium avium TaxID=1764 RepID=UPI001F26C27E
QRSRADQSSRREPGKSLQVRMNIVVRHRISITDGHQRGTAIGRGDPRTGPPDGRVIAGRTAP